MNDAPPTAEPVELHETPPTAPPPHTRREARAACPDPAATPRFLDRRGLLVAAVSGIAATGATGTALLHGGTSAATLDAVAGAGGSAASAGTANITTVSSSSSTAAHKAGFVLPKSVKPALLISRATYGRTATLERQVHAAGTTRWLAAQLKPSSIADPAGAAILARFPRLRWSTAKARASLKNGDWAIMQDLVAAHLARAIWSSRQLNEVMVDFWSNHLNVTCPSSDVWDTRHRYDADVIRANALGSFEKMLLASAFHPSMLVYLNNAQSTKDAPNENYARELLELHTVGIGSGYTEKDIHRGALLLTGWTADNSKAAYQADRHYVGRLSVFGFKTANATASGGRLQQQHYLKFLAHHPKTAMHISRKLAIRFVSDDPPAALVKRMAKAYVHSGTAIVPVLRVLFSSPEFAASRGAKMRRPMEVMAASTRALGIQPGKDTKGLMDLAWIMGGMGHAPLGWAQPNGYQDTADDWQSPSAALAQFNAGAALVHGWWPDKLANPGPGKLLSKPPKTRAGVISAVGVKVLGRKPTAKEHSAAATLLAGTTLPTSFANGTYQQSETIALVTTLFLSSPSHLVR